MKINSFKTDDRLSATCLSTILTLFLSNKSSMICTDSDNLSLR